MKKKYVKCESCENATEGTIMMKVEICRMQSKSLDTLVKSIDTNFLELTLLHVNKKTKVTFK